MASAIEITDVSKRFRLYHEKYSSLKERILHLGRVPYEDFMALSDINFSVGTGETLGLIGRNGSGKSTLLKCIAGILQPTTGEIRTVGRIAALLELGAGFHPELSGRDNVFLNAALLGISKKEIEKRFDDIVDFAELGAFIDNQVKHYSSGMYVRLGFAVAVNMEPDVLLVDEVLAVGDEAFQRKCLDRVKQFQKEGRTIVFVSHSADLVRQICDRAAVLDEGKMVSLAPPGEAIRSLREHLLAAGRLEATDAGVGGEQLLDHATNQEFKRNFEVRIEDVEVKYPSGAQHLRPGDPLELVVHYKANPGLKDVVFGLAVYDMGGQELFGSNTQQLGIEIPPLNETGILKFQFKNIPLLDGDYLVSLGIHSSDEGTVYDWREQEWRFSVMNPERSVGLVHLPIEVSVE